MKKMFSALGTLALGVVFLGASTGNAVALHQIFGSIPPPWEWFSQMTPINPLTAAEVSGGTAFLVGDTAEIRNEKNAFQSEVISQNRGILVDHREAIVHNSESVIMLDNRIRALRTEAREGVALALAVNSLSLSGTERFVFEVGLGHFESENALGVSGALRLHENISLTLGGGLGLNEQSTGGKVSMRIGY